MATVTITEVTEKAEKHQSQNIITDMCCSLLGGVNN